MLPELLRGKRSNHKISFNFITNPLMFSVYSCSIGENKIDSQTLQLKHSNVSTTVIRKQNTKSGYYYSPGETKLTIT